MDSGTASIIAGVVIGILSPFVQEKLVGAHITGGLAKVISTLVVPFLGGLVAFYVTDGFLNWDVPSCTAIAPGACVNYIWEEMAKIATISRVTYMIPGIGATGSGVSWSPGLVQKVAGTGN